MFWSRPAIRSALKMTATGALVTTVTTVSSCALANVIEGAAHRTLFRFFPHWYKDVQYAYGISKFELESVREGVTIAPDGETIATATDNSLAEIESKLHNWKDDRTEFNTFRSSGDKSDGVVLSAKVNSRNQNQNAWLRAGSEEISQHVLNVAMTG